jgi:hypothetical protein
VSFFLSHLTSYCNVIYSEGFHRQASKYLMRWRLNAMSIKIEDLNRVNEEVQGECYAANIRERQLQSQLNAERKRLVVETARNNVLERYAKKETAPR